MVLIANLWTTQRKLWRPEQLPCLMDLIESGVGFQSKIQLHRCPDGAIEVIDGHHRVTALWLLGRESLEYGECVIVEANKCHSRFGKIDVWCNKYNAWARGVTAA